MDLNSVFKINLSEIKKYKKYKNRYDLSFLREGCGVYGIRNIISNKIYIGGTVNLKKRIASHFARLRRGVHKKRNLQEDYDTIGMNNFEVIIFSYCEKEYLPTQEEEYYQYYKDNSYNKRHNTQTNKGLRHTDEVFRKIGKKVSKALKGKTPKNIDFMRSCQKRPIIEYTNNIATNKYESCREAGRVLGICYKRLNRIVVKNERGEKVSPLKEYPHKTWKYADNKGVRKVNRNI